MSAAAQEPAATMVPLTEYVCGTCGYGIRIAMQIAPACPMCCAVNWELPRDERPTVAH